MKKENQGLLNIEESLAAYRPMLREAAETIRVEDVSNYPIFIVHQGEAAIGLPLVEEENLQGGWKINVSTLEEFSVKQLIGPEKLSDFIALYKSHGDELCLFVIEETGAKFVFSKR